MAFRVRYKSSQGFNLGPLGFLIVANLILFVATMVRPDLFINLFGLSGRTFLSQPWTIVTSMFIHSPFTYWHVLGNMLTLYFFGSYLIGLIGEKKFLFVYFVGGLLGNAVFLLLEPFSRVIGASGAVFAVGGALAVLRPRTTVLLFGIVPLPLWVVVIGGFLVISPGVAWQAHLGGLVLGLGAGLLFRLRRRY